MEDLRAEDPRRIGAYQLVKRLGGGGMGQVFLGRSRGGRLLAVKLVRPELADAPGFRGRFRREVDAARQVGGFYTAHVLDADPDGDPPWLATAYIPGLSLEEAVVRHGALPEPSLGLLAAGLAEGLAAVHACGVVHRDLKPGNVILAADGPRLIDFGIARAAEDTRLTVSGVVIGTPGFMAPEYIVGDLAEPASDVFALGAVLAYAATGRPPFGSGAAHAVNYRAVHEPARLSGVPSTCIALIEDCLAKEAAKRPSAEQIVDRVPTWGTSGATWLPPRLTTMIDEARATDFPETATDRATATATDTAMGFPATASPGGGLSFFTSDVEIPTPEGWADAGRADGEQEAEEARARELRRRRIAHCRRLISGATTVSGSIDATQLRSRAFALVAAAAMPVEAERGRHLAGKAVRLAGEAPQGLDRVTALSHVAQALAGADDEWARTAAEQGVALAEGIRGLFSKGARRDALAVAAVGLAAVAPERAEKIATLVGGPRTLAEVAEAMAATAPARAERIARAIGEPTAAGRALADVAEAMAGTDPRRAERITRELDPDQADRVLLAVVHAQTAKDPERAARIAHRLEGSIGTSEVERLTRRAALALARTDPERAVRMAPPGYDEREIARRAVEQAASTDLARAEHLLRTFPEPARSSARNQLLGEMATADADRAERIARGISDDVERAEALATVFSGLFHSDFPRAQRVARAIPTDQPETRAYVLTCMASSLAPYDSTSADGLFSEAMAIVDGLRGDDDYDYIAMHHARTLVHRDPGRAADLARTIGDPKMRAVLLADMAAEIAPDQSERAMALFEQAAHIARDISQAALPAYTMVHIITTAAPHARQWATALAVDAVRTDREGAQQIAEALVEFAPEAAARVAADIVRTERGDHHDGDTYNIHGQDGLVLLAETDAREAARLAVSHDPADGPDAALYELVEALVLRVGWEVERLRES
ncbi:protein kinase [Streptomyces zhihengii]|uniref:serine/threonine protein kinase n=1 Tax=Streptomyces zhihengii TaxID=1818004 RepID=UPI003691F24A